jgi:hypothetical protein
VIVADWNTGAHKIYTQSTANTRTVGAVTARMINVLKDDLNCIKKGALKYMINRL